MLRNISKLFSKKLDVLVIVGPSGVGKGTIIKKLSEDYPKSFGFSISHTTRAPRSNEIDGIHYHFATKEWIVSEIQKGNFLESATVHGNIYGTRKSALEEVTKQNKICILDIDLQGAENVYKLNLDLKVRFMFIKPPSLEDLRERLTERNTEKPEEVERRMKNSASEMDILDNRLYSIFDCIIVNKDLQQCYSEVLDHLRKWNAQLTR